MKKVVMIILGLAVGYTYADSFSGMLSGTDSVKKISQIPSEKCLRYSDVTIITQVDDDLPGEHILVKNDPNASCAWESDSSWLIDSGEASYFKGKYKDKLIIDRGTGTNFRDILVYDLGSHNLIFSTSYEEPLKLDDGIISYWKNMDDIVASSDNCDKYEDGQKSGLVAQIQHNFSVDINSSSQAPKAIDSKKTRCNLVQ